MFTRIKKVMTSIFPVDLIVIKKKGGAYVLIHRTTWLGKVSEREYLIKDLMDASPAGFTIM